MKKILFVFLIIAIPANLMAMGHSERSSGAAVADDFQNEMDYFPDKAEIRYADNFSVEYFGHYKIVRVWNTEPENNDIHRYLLVQRGTPVPDGYPDANVVMIPVESIAALSTTYFEALQILGVLSTLEYIDSVSYTTDQTIVDNVAQGQTVQIGSGPSLNWEPLILNPPDLVMIMSTGTEYDSYPRLRQLNLPVVVNADWREQNPLGRAEWLKFIALFYNKEQEAESYFQTIETQYHQLSALAETARDKPVVLTSSPYGSVWGLPGRTSYLGKLIQDAGGRIPWDESSDDITILADPETVFLKASLADVWLVNSSGWKSLSSVAAENGRFAHFKAFQTGEVYNNDKRLNSSGGNDYWESGPYCPQRVLADIISILHPELLPEYSPYYFRRVDP